MEWFWEPIKKKLGEEKIIYSNICIENNLSCREIIKRN